MKKQNGRNVANNLVDRRGRGRTPSTPFLQPPWKYPFPRPFQRVQRVRRALLLAAVSRSVGSRWAPLEIALE